jgi:DNA-binding protein Alba|tara:strand:+ start:3914 stop:4195 length:282 start_codon:yes stop_codon:yes gene_type:complete
LGIQETEQENDFFVEDDPIMQSATDALMQMSKIGKICLKAKGDLIPNAVSIANIIIDNFLKNNSKIDRILLDSEISSNDGRMISNIEIFLVKN